jgi:hypothetical protein
MVRKLLLVAVAVAALGGPARSEAQVGLGARIGYAFGTGDVAADSAGTTKMSDWTKAQIPIQVDLMFHLVPGLSIGPYFSYGFGRTGGDLDDACSLTGRDCSTSVIRLGGQVTYALPPPLPFWFGAGLGYEWNKVDTDGEGEITVRGVEWLNLQAGVDFLATPVLRFGPFVMLSLGRYDEGELTGFGSGSIDDKKMHQWFEIGVRGMFDL